MPEPLKIPIECIFNEDGLKGALQFVADLQEKYDTLENEVMRVFELVINLRKGVAPNQIMCSNTYLQEITKYLLNPNNE